MLLGIDLLRIFAATAVVAIHYSAPFITNPAFMTENPSLWRGLALLDSVSRFSVPVFVVLTGFGFQAIVFQADYKERVSKKVKGILYLTAFSTVIFLFYRTYLGDFGFELDQMLCRIMKAVIAGKPYFHLWYFYMAIGLVSFGALISPVLGRVKEYKEKIMIVLFAFFFCQLVSIQDFYYENKNLFIFWFIEYLGYFIFGFYLNSFRLAINRTVLISLFIAASVGILFWYELSVSAYGFKRGAFPFDFVSPLVLLQVLVLVLFFTSVRQTSPTYVRL